MGGNFGNVEQKSKKLKKRNIKELAMPGNDVNKQYEQVINK